MLVLLAYHYAGFLSESISFFPNHLLSAIFCAVTMFVYPLCIFKEKKLRVAGAVLSAVLLLAATVFVLVQGGTSYDTDVLSSGGSLGVEFDDTYTAEFADPAFGTCEMRYEENIDAWMVHARFTKTGETQLILRAPDGTEQIFDLTVGRDTYDIAPAAEP